jgi:hypothetical protein
VRAAKALKAFEREEGRWNMEGATLVIDKLQRKLRQPQLIVFNLEVERISSGAIAA